MPRHLSMIFIFLATSQASAGQAWHKQNIDNIAAIEFPHPPVFRDNDSIAQYYAKIDSAVCSIQFRKIPADAMLEDSNDVMRFYEFILLQSLNISNGQLISRKYIDIAGLKCLEFDISTNKLPKGFDRISYRLACHKSHSFIISFLSYSSREFKDVFVKKYFFDSFTPVFTEATTRSWKAYTLYTALAVIVTLLFVFIIRRRSV